MRLLRHLRERLILRRPSIFLNFAAAARVSHGYVDPRVIDLVVKKTERLREATTAGDLAPQTVQDLAVIQRAAREGEVEVVDVGGACGATFFELDRLFPRAIARWHVVETPQMVERAQGFATDRLSFHTDLEGATADRVPDLLFLKGMLHYVPDPIAFLSHMASLGSRYIYLARTPATERGSYFIAQSTWLRDHGPGYLPDVERGRILLPAALVPWSNYLTCLTPSYEPVWGFERGPQWTLRNSVVHDRAVLVERRS